MRPPAWDKTSGQDSIGGGWLIGVQDQGPVGCCDAVEEARGARDVGEQKVPRLREPRPFGGIIAAMMTRSGVRGS